MGIGLDELLLVLAIGTGAICILVGAVYLTILSIRKLFRHDDQP